MARSSRGTARPTPPVPVPAPAADDAPAGQPIINWADSDYNTEALLTQYGYKFRLVEVQNDEVDVERSQKNFARFGKPINKDRIDQIMNRAKSTGLMFPPAVGWRPPELEGKVVLNDANHRFVANVEAGNTSFKMYELLDVGPKRAEFITRVMNSMEGQGHTADELLSHAVVYAQENPQINPTEVAEMFGVTPARLRSRLKVEDYRRRFEDVKELPVSNHTRVSNSLLADIIPIGNDVVIQLVVAGLARLLPRVDSESVKKMIAAIRKAPKIQDRQVAVAQEQLALLSQVRAETGGGTRAVRKTSQTASQRARSEAGRYLHSLGTYFPKGVSPKDVVTTTEERDDLLERFAAVVRAQNAIRAGLKTGE